MSSYELSERSGLLSRSKVHSIYCSWVVLVCSVKSKSRAFCKHPNPILVRVSSGHAVALGEARVPGPSPPPARSCTSILPVGASASNGVHSQVRQMGSTRRSPTACQAHPIPTARRQLRVSHTVAGNLRQGLHRFIWPGSPVKRVNRLRATV